MNCNFIEFNEGDFLVKVLESKKELIGIARLIFSYMPMMTEKEFSELVSPFHRIQKDINTAEVTRLGIRKLMRKKSKRQAVMAIYKGIYLWSILNDVRYLYLVAEKRMFRAFTITGFPCKRIGPVITLNGGVESLAAKLDWREFEKTSKLFSYFLQGNNFQLERLGNRMAAS